MTVSLKIAAERFLRWNIEGQKHAKPTRGLWVTREITSAKCFACKIGLVMIGRYGLEKALGRDGTGDSTLIDRTTAYGPPMNCPVKSCKYPIIDEEWWDNRKASFGYIVEHLFEKHKWTVVRLDKWLAGLAEVEYADYVS